MGQLLLADSAAVAAHWWLYAEQTYLYDHFPAHDTATLSRVFFLRAHNIFGFLLLLLLFSLFLGYLYVAALFHYFQYIT